mgnify:CR=1 FL=1
MFNQNLELTEEFPQFKEAIHQLKMKDAHFARLYDTYHLMTRRMDRIAQQIETLSDNEVEVLKKKRLAVKDELYGMLKGVAA